MAKEPIIKLSAKKFKERWNPVYNDNRKWLLGFYKPKAKSLKEVKYLEKHKYPELFVLLEGEIVLVLRDKKESANKKLRLKMGEAVIVNCWHNGYALKPKSAALVIERPKNPTKYRV